MRWPSFPQMSRIVMFWRELQPDWEDFAGRATGGMQPCITSSSPAQVDQSLPSLHQIIITDPRSVMMIWCTTPGRPDEHYFPGLFRTATIRWMLISPMINWSMGKWIQIQCGSLSNLHNLKTILKLFSAWLKRLSQPINWLFWSKMDVQCTWCNSVWCENAFFGSLSLFFIKIKSSSSSQTLCMLGPSFLFKSHCWFEAEKDKGTKIPCLSKQLSREKVVGCIMQGNGSK